MFTIRKIHKFQRYFNLDSSLSTIDIDSLRKSRSIDQVKITSSTVSNIIELMPSEEIRKQIDQYFPKRGDTIKIHAFFVAHPHVFSDLIRIIHKYRLNNSSDGWHIPKKHIHDVQSVFLFRDRKNDIGNLIPEFVEVVCDQKEFIEFASKQASILDINSYDFAQIKAKNRKKNIRKLISTGLVTNILGCTEGNIDQFFGHSKDRIFHYLNEIFGIELSSISWLQTLDQLTDNLSLMFETGQGNDRKKAWKVIQAFHAWGDILNIEKEFANTMERCNDVPKKLHASGFIMQGDMSESMNGQGVTIYSADFLFNKNRIRVSWRAKNPKSMLKKLWESEAYVRSSAIRDELGISFVYEDDASQDTIVAIMQAGSHLLSHNGYILKNKGELDNEDTFQKVSTKTKKKPLFSEHKLGGDPKMKNASQSGFMNLGEGKNKRAIGCEIQYSRKSAKKWKDQEDPIYKFRGAIDALMRGAHQATPKEIFDALTREIHLSDIPKLSDPDTGESLNLSTYNDVMLYLIQIKKIILPYFGKVRGKYVLLFTTVTHKEEFMKRWRMNYLEKNKNSTYQKRYVEMSTVIKELKQRH